MIIGLSGKIGTGKSTIANIFEDNGYHLDSFANSIKDISNIIFGFDKNILEGFTKENRELKEKPDEHYSSFLNKSFSPRDSLLLIGELGRNNIHPDIWVEPVFNRYNLNKNKKLLITDVRFPNEYNMIKKRGGVIFRINRDNSYKLNHETECALDNYNFDYVIDNNGTLEELVEKIKNLIRTSSFIVK